MPSRSHTAAPWGRCHGPPHGSQRRAALGVSIHTGDAPRGWRQQKSGLPIHTGTPAGRPPHSASVSPGVPAAPDPAYPDCQGAGRGPGWRTTPLAPRHPWPLGSRRAGCWVLGAGAEPGAAARAERRLRRRRCALGAHPPSPPSAPRACGTAARAPAGTTAGPGVRPPRPPRLRARPSRLSGDLAPGCGAGGPWEGAPDQRPALRRGDCASAAARGKVSGLREEAPREGPGRAEAAVSARPSARPRSWGPHLAREVGVMHPAPPVWAPPPLPSCSLGHPGLPPWPGTHLRRTPLRRSKRAVTERWAGPALPGAFSEIMGLSFPRAEPYCL